MRSSRRRVVLTLAVTAGVAVALVLALPHMAGMRQAWHRASSGDAWWLTAALGFEVLSFAAYAALFTLVLGGDRVGLRLSVLITLAGVAATRVLNAGGAGGIALTAWALRRAGRGVHDTTAGMTAFLLLLYSVYMLALVLVGGGLLLGVLDGYAPVALSTPAVVLGAAALIAVPALGLTRRPGARVPQDGRMRRIVELLDGIPAGVRYALRVLRERDVRLAGAVGWWAFDIAALWASLRAFGEHPAMAPLVLAYFMGMLGNLLPLPGGLGGVEGGMIGALIACAIPAGVAVAAVLAYRIVSLWLPTAAGAIAYPLLIKELRPLSAVDDPVTPLASPS